MQRICFKKDPGLLFKSGMSSMTAMLCLLEHHVRHLRKRAAKKPKWKAIHRLWAKTKKALFLESFVTCAAVDLQRAKYHTLTLLRTCR